ncbi:diguanylate cyclase [Corallincola holothuriorum]|uniref:Diguanylate cyclase n=1 Tax=Corallincola holothuriorum TaxID=2282215 RepID=A0A368N8D3_9GAMM|nr:transporter substrate-binding domain-containing protein [Corallincola holothuriorum]RCU45519.1 diguanylate cyclase [Corallincola holothuriorum]
MRRTLTLFFTLCCFSFSMHAAPLIHNPVASDSEALFLDILKLALSKSAPGTKYQALSEPVNQARGMEMIDAGKMSVMWAGTTPDFEKRMAPVRIPVLKGLLGHRIFIIRGNDQARFSAIKNLADLKRLTAGQGRFWGDTFILQANDIPVATTIKYHNLFPMLEGGRFDYFPRAVNEPWGEVQRNKELGLKVDDNVLLIYPFAMYFFVNKDDKKLHDLIYKGFEAAIADGSYDKLFFNHPMIKEALQLSKLKQRTVIRLPNPLMDPKTPVNRKEFWLDINSL